MYPINKTAKGDDAISIMNYVNSSKVFFQYSYAAISLVEPYPEYKTEVYEALKGGYLVLLCLYIVLLTCVKFHIKVSFEYNNIPIATVLTVFRRTSSFDRILSRRSAGTISLSLQ